MARFLSTTSKTIWNRTRTLTQTFPWTLYSDWCWSNVAYSAPNNWKRSPCWSSTWPTHWWPCSAHAPWSGRRPDTASRAGAPSTSTRQSRTLTSSSSAGCSGPCTRRWRSCARPSSCRRSPTSFGAARRTAAESSRTRSRPAWTKRWLWCACSSRRRGWRWRRCSRRRWRPTGGWPLSRTIMIFKQSRSLIRG